VANLESRARDAQQYNVLARRHAGTQVAAQACTCTGARSCTSGCNKQTNKYTHRCGTACHTPSGSKQQCRPYQCKAGCGQVHVRMHVQTGWNRLCWISLRPSITQL
jgi:hypothetical protein